MLRRLGIFGSDFSNVKQARRRRSNHQLCSNFFTKKVGRGEFYRKKNKFSCKVEKSEKRLVILRETIWQQGTLLLEYMRSHL